MRKHVFLDFLHSSLDLKIFVCACVYFGQKINADKMGRGGHRNSNSTSPSKKRPSLLCSQIGVGQND